MVPRPRENSEPNAKSGGSSGLVCQEARSWFRSIKERTRVPAFLQGPARASLHRRVRRDGSLGAVLRCRPTRHGPFWHGRYQEAGGRLPKATRGTQERVRKPQKKAVARPRHLVGQTPEAAG